MVKSIERFHCIGAQDDECIGFEGVDIGFTQDNGVFGAGTKEDCWATGDIGLGEIGTGALGACTKGTCGEGVLGVRTKGVFGACTKGIFGACAKGIFGVCVSFIIMYKYKIIKLFF